MITPTSTRHSILREIADERDAQTAKHGDQSHLPMGTGQNLRLYDMPISWGSDAGRMNTFSEAVGLAEWAKDRCKAASQNEGGDGTITFEHILTEEYAEVIAESNPALLRAELIQLAAVAVQMVEAIDRLARLVDAG